MGKGENMRRSLSRLSRGVLFAVPIACLLGVLWHFRFRERHVLASNETYAIHCLRMYRDAQRSFKVKNYSAHVDADRVNWYAWDLQHLYGLEISTAAGKRTLTMIPQNMTSAVSPSTSNSGYYFVQANVARDEFQLYATPCQYGRTGRLTFYIDQQGIILTKDMGGRKVDPAVAPDSSWHGLE